MHSNKLQAETLISSCPSAVVKQDKGQTQGRCHLSDGLAGPVGKAVLPVGHLLHAPPGSSAGGAQHLKDLEQLSNLHR